MEGTSVACIDNIERDFGGDALCSVLTQESWRDRVLGKTMTATVPTTTTWLATGNNIRFVGDVTTRVIPCDLDPHCERPEERRFDVNLHEWVPKNRAELVVAGLTVLRAYRVAGEPPQGLPVFGRFEDWSRVVRSALVWCGEADPCEGRRRIEETDPVRSQLRALLLPWHAEFKSEPKTAAEVILHTEESTAGSDRRLQQALLEVAGKGGKVDSRRLGNYLAKNERRQEEGLRVERVGERQGVALWRCASAATPSRPAAPESVGFVGLVGSSGSTGTASDASPVELRASEGAEEIEPAETNPRNPRNPPLEGAESAGGEEAALLASLVDAFDGELLGDSETGAEAAL